jgi:hypothetical protein
MASCTTDKKALILKTIYKHDSIMSSSLVAPPYRGEGVEYARDPESYTSGSVASGRASLTGQVKG